MDEEWSSDLPDKPGDYLFYGRFGRPDRFQQSWTRWEVCHVGCASNGVLMYSTGGLYLEKGEFTGKFQKLKVAPPTLEGA
jgi:hypothetical protein